MATLILAGQGRSNKDWLDSMVERIEGQAVPFGYLHWSGSGELDFDAELARLHALPERNELKGVVAKSAGTLLALYAVEQGILMPDRQLFMGIPLRWAQAKGLDQVLLRLLRSNAVPTMFVQQKDDPICSSGELSSLGFDVHEVEGCNHKYDDFDQLTPYLARYIG